MCSCQQEGTFLTSEKAQEACIGIPLSFRGLNSLTALPFTLMLEKASIHEAMLSPFLLGDTYMVR